MENQCPFCNNDMTKSEINENIFVCSNKDCNKRLTEKMLDEARGYVFPQTGNLSGVFRNKIILDASGYEFIKDILEWGTLREIRKEEVEETK